VRFFTVEKKVVQHSLYVLLCASRGTHLTYGAFFESVYVIYGVVEVPLISRFTVGYGNSVLSELRRL